MAAGICDVSDQSQKPETVILTIIRGTFLLMIFPWNGSWDSGATILVVDSGENCAQFVKELEKQIRDRPCYQHIAIKCQSTISIELERQFRISYLLFMLNMEDEEGFARLASNLKKVSPHFFFGRATIVVNTGRGPSHWTISLQSLEQLAHVYDAVIMYCNFQSVESLVGTVARVFKGFEQSMQWNSPLSLLSLKTADIIFIPQTRNET